MFPTREMPPVHPQPRRRRVVVISEQPALAWEACCGTGSECGEAALELRLARSVGAAFGMAGGAPRPDVILAGVAMLTHSTAGVELAGWLERLRGSGHPRLELVRATERPHEYLHPARAPGRALPDGRARRAGLECAHGTHIPAQGGES